MIVTFRVVGITRDRRNAQQLASWSAIQQAIADQRFEYRWRERVAANIQRRIAARVTALVDTSAADDCALLRRQAG